jgi:hypothetical protein
MTKPTGRPRGRPRKHPRPDDTPTTATTLEAKAPEEGELEQLESEIADMERELTAESEPLVWGEVDAGELACREQRRGVLPRLITAAKIKRLVLQKRRTEAELEELRKECDREWTIVERAASGREKPTRRSRMCSAPGSRLTAPAIGSQMRAA